MSITDWRFWENSIPPGSPLSWSRLMTSSRRTKLLHHDRLIFYNWIMISTSNHIHLSSISPGGSKWFVYECSSIRYLQSLINIPKFSDWLEDLKGAPRAWKVNKFDQHCSHSGPNLQSKSSGARYLSFSTLSRVSNANRARVDKLAHSEWYLSSFRRIITVRRGKRVRYWSCKKVSTMPSLIKSCCSRFPPMYFYCLVW